MNDLEFPRSIRPPTSEKYSVYVRDLASGELEEQWESNSSSAVKDWAKNRTGPGKQVELEGQLVCEPEQLPNSPTLDDLRRLSRKNPITLKRETISFPVDGFAFIQRKVERFFRFSSIDDAPFTLQYDKREAKNQIIHRMDHDEFYGTSKMNDQILGLFTGSPQRAAANTVVADLKQLPSKKKIYLDQQYGDNDYEWNVSDIVDFIKERGIKPQWLKIDGMLQNLEPSPEDVKNPDNLPGSPEFVERADLADLGFPIIAAMYPDGIWIIDGVHRLWKAHNQGRKEISGYLLTKEQLDQIKKKENNKEASVIAKNAGALEIPPKMKQMAYERVAQALHELLNEQNQIPDSFPKKSIEIPLDLEGWKYTDKISQISGRIKNLDLGSNYLNLKIDLITVPKESTGPAGKYSKEVITIYVLPGVVDPKYWVPVLDHELTHYAQNLIEFAIGTLERLPTYGPSYTTDGTPYELEKYRKQDHLSPEEWKQFQADLDWQQPHEEIAAELDANAVGFATRFLQNLGHIPKELHKPYLRIVLGLNLDQPVDLSQYSEETQNEFDAARKDFVFWDLKTRKPKLWKIYVKKFLDQVEKLQKEEATTASTLLPLVKTAVHPAVENIIDQIHMVFDEVANDPKAANQLPLFRQILQETGSKVIINMSDWLSRDPQLLMAKVWWGNLVSHLQFLKQDLIGLTKFWTKEGPHPKLIHLADQIYQQASQIFKASDYKAGWDLAHALQDLKVDPKAPQDAWFEEWTNRQEKEASKIIPLIVQARSDWSEIEKYVDQPDTFIHFSDLPKLGINPGTSYETPAGIYGYPLHRDIYEELKKGEWFATGRKYAHVFKITPSPQNLSQITADDVERVWDFIENKNLTVLKPFGSTEKLGRYDPDVKQNAKKVFFGNEEKMGAAKHPASEFWYLTRLAANENPIRWNALFRALGYSGFYDPGGGLIHINEPNQGFALSGPNTQLLYTLTNPSGDEKKEQQKTKYETYDPNSLKWQVKDEKALEKAMPHMPDETIWKFLAENYSHPKSRLMAWHEVMKRGFDRFSKFHGILNPDAIERLLADLRPAAGPHPIYGFIVDFAWTPFGAVRKIEFQGGLPAVQAAANMATNYNNVAQVLRSMHGAWGSGADAKYKDLARAFCQGAAENSNLREDVKEMAETYLANIRSTDPRSPEDDE